MFVNKEGALHQKVCQIFQEKYMIFSLALGKIISNFSLILAHPEYL